MSERIRSIARSIIFVCCIKLIPVAAYVWANHKGFADIFIFILEVGVPLNLLAWATHQPWFPEGIKSLSFLILVIGFLFLYMALLNVRFPSASGDHYHGPWRRWLEKKFRPPTSPPELKDHPYR